MNLDFDKSGSRSTLKQALLASSFAVSGVALAGSGGETSSLRSFGLQSYSTSPSIIIGKYNKYPLEDNNKVTQQLDFIKDTFSLTDEELSKACNVSSRKTLSNWKENGTIPRNNNRNRVFKLYLLAQDWNDQNFPRNKDAVTRRVLKEQSVLDILQEEELDSQKALFAGRRLLRESSKSESITLL